MLGYWVMQDTHWSPFLMTPFRSAAEGSQQNSYNGAHTKARNIIERRIGVLKNRFRCLLSARQLHYTPQKTIQIANVCAALHNICIYHRVSTMPTEETLQTSHEEAHAQNETESALAINIRNRIMTSIVNAQNS